MMEMILTSVLTSVIIWIILTTLLTALVTWMLLRDKPFTQCFESIIVVGLPPWEIRVWMDRPMLESDADYKKMVSFITGLTFACPLNGIPINIAGAISRREGVSAVEVTNVLSQSDGKGVLLKHGVLIYNNWP